MADGLYAQPANLTIIKDHTFAPLSEVASHQITYMTGSDVRTALFGEGGDLNFITNLLASNTSEICSALHAPCVSWLTSPPRCIILADASSDDLVCSIIPKEPGTDEFGLSTHQEMSKRLTSLRLSHGIVAPIGIISTYNEYQFCWHQYATPVAEATTIVQVKQIRDRDPASTDFDTLCVSRLYSCEEPETLQLLASCFLKAVRSKRSRMCHWAFTKTQVLSKIPGLDHALLDAKKLPIKGQTLYAVKILRCDSCSVTFQMMSEDGARCIAKIFGARVDQLDCELTAAEEEAAMAELIAHRDAWTQVYGEAPGFWPTRLANKPALIMPHYEQVLSAEWKPNSTYQMKQYHLRAIKSFGLDISPDRKQFVWADRSKSSMRLVDWAGVQPAPPGRAKE